MRDRSAAGAPTTEPASDQEIVEWVRGFYGSEMASRIASFLAEGDNGFNEHLRRSFTWEMRESRKVAGAEAGT